MFLRKPYNAFAIERQRTVMESTAAVMDREYIACLPYAVRVTEARDVEQAARESQVSKIHTQGNNRIVFHIWPI